MALDMWATHKTDIGVVPVSVPVCFSASFRCLFLCPYIPESATASGALRKSYQGIGNIFLSRKLSPFSEYKLI